MEGNAADWSGNDNHGVLHDPLGRAAWGAGAPDGDNPDGGLWLSPGSGAANNPYVWVDNSAGQFPISDGFTVSAWIRPNFGAGYGHTVIGTTYKYDSATGQQDDTLGWSLKRRAGTSNQMAFRIGNTRLVTGTDLTTGNWYHITGTFDGTTARMYIHVPDGQGGYTLWNQQSAGATGVNTADHIQIGRLINQPYSTVGEWGADPSKDQQTFWNGGLDDVRFYDHGLTLSQVEEILVAGGILPTITDHPTDQSKSVGETATFSVTATGADGYQWQLNDGSGWADIDLATDPDYTTPTLTAADDGNQYRCIVWNAYGSVESDPATLTVTVPCADPVLLSAYSVMTHGAAGDFAVEIELGEPYAIEPRAGADHRLLFVFDQEIDITDADVALSSGEATLSLAGTHILVATMTTLPDNNECLTITVSGVKDATGVCEMTPVTVYLTMIQGEVDNSPPVNLTDLSIVRAELYQPVTDDNFMSDVNADGVINLTDLSLVRDNLYQQAACP